jgi:hypothetical protein
VTEAAASADLFFFGYCGEVQFRPKMIYPYPQPHLYEQRNGNKNGFPHPELMLHIQSYFPIPFQHLIQTPPKVTFAGLFNIMCITHMIFNGFFFEILQHGGLIVFLVKD